MIFCSVAQLILIYVKTLWNRLMQFVTNLGPAIGGKNRSRPPPPRYITFLGLGINFINQTIFIPKNKVDTLKSMIHNVYTRRKVKLQVMQSLVGSLAFLTKKIPAGRAFCRRFYKSLARIQNESLHYII